uniref:Uncharacterized protein n=1 Tax=viral metagenome TaxID=1070528 RepID=A0A6M3K2C7_9ZZZZ
MCEPGKTIRWHKDVEEKRTVMGEDVKSILEGTLHVLQIYTDVLNIMTPRTILIDEGALKNVVEDTTKV